MKLVLERPRKKQVRVQPPTPAVNVTLLTFTADRRAAAASLLLGAGRATIDRYPARWAHSSKPAARCCSGR